MSDVVEESLSTNQPMPLAQSVLSMLKEQDVVLPPDEKIAEWKVQYGRLYLLYLTNNTAIIIRPIKRKEWRVMTEGKNMEVPTVLEQHQEEVAHTCVLFPVYTLEELHDDVDAGYILSVYNASMSSSGFQPTDNPLPL